MKIAKKLNFLEKKREKERKNVSRTHLVLSLSALAVEAGEICGM